MACAVMGSMVNLVTKTSQLPGGVLCWFWPGKPEMGFRTGKPLAALSGVLLGAALLTDLVRPVRTMPVPLAATAKPCSSNAPPTVAAMVTVGSITRGLAASYRSEEHTSELQS